MIVSVVKFNPAAPIQSEPWEERKRKGWVSIGLVQYDRNGALPFKGRLDKKLYWLQEVGMSSKIDAERR